MPRYTRAAYGGETVTLENDHLRLELHRRRSGWAWGELFVPCDGGPRLMAVLEHLGEVKLAQLHQPARLEAASVERHGDTLTFPVALATGMHPKHAILEAPPITGTVTLSLAPDAPAVDMCLRLTAHTLVHMERLRGPWLRVGAQAFGAAKDDALLPGVEWLVGDEWSSGTEHFEHPWALRRAPHPHKVAIPVMAVSHGGAAVGLEWDPRQTCMSTRLRMRCPQPVFASPNFIDRRSEHLLGLMWPSARWGLAENALAADPPLDIAEDHSLALDARIRVGRGSAFDLVLDKVAHDGLPEPGPPRYAWHEVIDRCARAYDTHLWVEGAGFRGGGQAYGSEDRGRPVVPRFVQMYCDRADPSPLRDRLAERAAWCRAHAEAPSPPERDPLLSPMFPMMEQPDRTRELADGLLAVQTPEGDFPFAPAGRHRTDHLEHAAEWRPMSLAGDSALFLCTDAAGALLVAADRLGSARYASSARRALDFALTLGDRPEGGDAWETPLRAPNLLAAGGSAIAYALAHRRFGDDRYLRRARHWIRCLIPFTHLWQPPDAPKLYNTNPCFCASAWWLASWVNKHVQWEVLRTFAYSRRLGLDWAAIDPAFDWARYHRGVATASLRWLIDHTDAHFMYRCEFPADLAADGAWDMLWADAYDPAADTYGGGPLSPEQIAETAWIMME